MWKVYRAIKADKSKREVSIFIFDKKSIDKSLKKHREDIYAFIRKESQSLAKYKHPGIVGLIEPMMEDEKNIVFITEPL